MTRTVDQFRNRVTFLKKLKSVGTDGQPMISYQVAFSCLASIVARPMSEVVSGDIVMSGTRWTITTWRCQQTSEITSDDLIELNDGTRIEIDSIVPNQLTVIFEGAERASIRDST